MNKSVLLIIMDGYGLSESSEYNAIYKANTPNLDKIFSRYPTTSLHASGLHVGLPDGQMGNSEVGHMNLGAGRIVYQDLTFINKSIKDNEFIKNKVLNNVIDCTISNNSTLHIMGLLSDGGIHSHINHLYELLKLAKFKKLSKVCIHAWTDGRDTSQMSGIGYLKSLANFIDNLGIGEIKTICGRYYSMDRDNNLSRTRLAYDAIFYGKGVKTNNLSNELKNLYSSGITDEFINPIVLDSYDGISSNDSIICFNYRPDRARQITKMLCGKVEKYVCLTEYDKNIKNVSVAFEPRIIKNTLGEIISKMGMKQMRIAETEKYAHVTFFFNAGTEVPFALEDRIIIPSPKVETYDLKPEMSAYEVLEATKKAINSKQYNLIVVNFANPDMLGHTGNINATIKAVETVDKCVKELVDIMNMSGGVTVLTADHGNAEKMKDENGNPFTSHTTNMVPFSIIGVPCTLKKDCSLCDVAPTILDIMGIPKPADMFGNTVIERKICL